MTAGPMPSRRICADRRYRRKDSSSRRVGAIPEHPAGDEPHHHGRITARAEVIPDAGRQDIQGARKQTVVYDRSHIVMGATQVQSNDFRSSRGESAVFMLKSLLNACECSKPNA